MWDQFTPENAGQWRNVQPSSSTFNWKTLDAMYQYCDDNHITFRHMAFVSSSSPPAWVDATVARTAVPALMKAVCDRYPKTRVIDVVNEPLHGRPSYLEGLGGAGASGYDWVAQAFKGAREACPNAVLVVNDFNIIEYESDHKKFLELMKAMKDLNVPIMAVGAEGHEAYKVSHSTVATYLADIVSQTGLPVYISELDIGAQDDGEQATIMKDLVTMFWNDPNVLGITYWGYIVGKTWRSNTGLLQEDGTKRPALTWLMDFLGR
jgi:endo-1,4-beta-xylanase